MALKPIPVLLSVAFLTQTRLRERVVQVMDKYSLLPIIHENVPGLREFKALRDCFPERLAI